MQNAAPIVSIIVPIYNVERYLQQCIDSICAQTYRQLEIILVDDGSPDQCGKICDNNAEADSRIVVIHKENSGLSSARNAGLDIAKGEYVSFVDADDTIHPEFIETLLGLCRQYRCDIAQCDYLTVTENSFKLPLNTLQSIKIYNNKQALYELCCSSYGTKYAIACNKVYKKELFQNLRYPVGKMNEDEAVIYLLLWKAKKLAVTNQYMYYYLQRKDSIMNSAFSIKRLDALEAFKSRLDFLREKQLWEAYEATLRTRIYLIERSYFLLKKNAEDSLDVCNKLLVEKEEMEKLLNAFESDKPQMLQKYINRKCHIVLYGAGALGQTCYQQIKANQWGMVVGWVDNSWNEIKETEYPIKPVDTVLEIQFDYILIAIKNKEMREEVAANLMSWGVPEKKIITEIFM